MSGHKPFSELRRKMSPEAQARAAEKAAALEAEMPLHELRAAMDMSQSHLAEILHVDQPAISRLERRTDMMLSTLRHFVEAMGGRLDIRAIFPNGEVKIKGLSDVRAKRRELA